ncbi:MAG: LysR family transcriptional regulator [Alphaproteobacteria bacterium]|nr:LysR family transcriptional regulator [Alphaproteobacteria bacterium]
METLPHIDTFVVLARERSYSEAARLLGVPRSTVSRRVRRLEEALGERLVERTTRHVALTDAGRMVLERAGPLVAQLRDVADSVAQLRGEPGGLLRVAAQPGLGRQFLEFFLSEFRERYPKVRLDMQVHSSPVHLLDDDLDVLLVEGPLPPGTPWLARALGPADHVAVASPAYLARRGRPACVEALRQHDTITLSDARSDEDAWPLRRGGVVRLRSCIRSNDLGVVRQAVLAGLGIALASITAFPTDLAAGALELVLPEVVGESRKLFGLYAPSRRGSPKIQAFFDLVAEAESHFG